MRLNKILSLAAVVTLVFVASAPASAQGSFSIGFAKFGKHSSFGVGITSGLYPRPGRVIVVDPIPCRTYVPGCYVTRCIEVWVPGCVERVWVEPCYETVTDHCGNVARVLVREGFFKTIEKGGHFETRHVQVWVPGHYV
jgi:hypothetical protein